MLALYLLIFLFVELGRQEGQILEGQDPDKGLLTSFEESIEESIKEDVIDEIWPEIEKRIEDKIKELCSKKCKSQTKQNDFSFENISEKEKQLLNQYIYEYVSLLQDGELFQTNVQRIYIVDIQNQDTILGKSLNQTQEDLKIQSSNLTEQAQNIRDDGTNIKDLYNISKKLNESLVNFHSNISDLENKTSQNFDKIGIQQGNISDLYNSSKMMDYSITELYNKTDNIEGKLDVYGQNISDFDRSIRNNSDKIGGISNNISDLYSISNQTNINVVGIQNNISDLDNSTRSRFEIQGQNISDFDKEIRNNSANIEKNSQNITVLQNETKILKKSQQDQSDYLHGNNTELQESIDGKQCNCIEDSQQDSQWFTGPQVFNYIFFFIERAAFIYLGYIVKKLYYNKDIQQQHENLRYQIDQDLVNKFIQYQQLAVHNNIQELQNNQDIEQQPQQFQQLLNMMSIAIVNGLLGINTKQFQQGDQQQQNKDQNQVQQQFENQPLSVN